MTYTQTSDVEYVKKENILDQTCLVCLRGCSSSEANIIVTETSCLNKHLFSIFFLRHLLRYPKAECEKLLEKYSSLNPDDWCSACVPCSALINTAFEAYQKIVKLEKEMQRVRDELMSKLNESIFSDIVGGYDNISSSVDIIPISVQDIPLFIRDYFKRRFSPSIEEENITSDAVHEVKTEGSEIPMGNAWVYMEELDDSDNNQDLTENDPLFIPDKTEALVQNRERNENSSGSNSRLCQPSSNDFDLNFQLSYDKLNSDSEPSNESASNYSQPSSDNSESDFLPSGNSDSDSDSTSDKSVVKGRKTSFSQKLVTTFKRQIGTRASTSSANEKNVNESLIGIVKSCKDHNRNELGLCGCITAFEERLKTQMRLLKIAPGYKCSKRNCRFSTKKLHAYLAHKNDHYKKENVKPTRLKRVSSKIHALPTLITSTAKPPKPLTTLQKPSEMIHSCQLCRQAFSNFNNYKTHLNQHVYEREKTCMLCSKTFSFPSQLVKHLSFYH